jgi:hypothetical protein
MISFSGDLDMMEFRDCEALLAMYVEIHEIMKLVWCGKESVKKGEGSVIQE